jgi:hypothetical protein
MKATTKKKTTRKNFLMNHRAILALKNKHFSWKGGIENGSKFSACVAKFFFCIDRDVCWSMI